jgi:hypothetical protein
MSISGKRIAEIRDEATGSGMRTLIWNTAAIAAGMYLIEFTVGNYHLQKRFLVSHRPEATAASYPTLPLR